jgi:hypothetical protein
VLDGLRRPAEIDIERAPVETGVVRIAALRIERVSAAGRLKASRKANWQRSSRS